jgi:hypothetical protein
MKPFAYFLDNEMICPKCAKGLEGIEELLSKDYSFGFEVIGCYQCSETLKTPF